MIEVYFINPRPSRLEILGNIEFFYSASFYILHSGVELSGESMLKKCNCERYSILYYDCYYPFRRCCSSD